MTNVRKCKMLSLKALKPTLRERKRYIVYQIDFDSKQKNAKTELKNFQTILIDKLKLNLGIFSSAKAGILPIAYDGEKFMGILRVNNKMIDEIRANFVLITELNKVPVCIKTLGVSGILKKAKELYT
jgi:ribonuclease P/MRP protein subunit POP5